MKAVEVRHLAEEFSERLTREDGFDEEAAIDHFEGMGIKLTAYTNKFVDDVIILNFERKENPADDGWVIFRGNDMEVVDIMEAVDHFDW